LHPPFLENSARFDAQHQSDFGNSLVSSWLDSIHGSGRNTYCRSDSYLHRSVASPILRHVSKSAPTMGDLRDADGFVVPPTPVSTGSRPHRRDGSAWASSSHGGSAAPSDVSASDRSSKKSLVEEPFYRTRNLRSNHIHLCGPNEELPQPIADLVQRVGQDRDSPGPSVAQLRDARSCTSSRMAPANLRWRTTSRTACFPNRSLRAS
jgi:hypothetical protein